MVRKMVLALWVISRPLRRLSSSAGFVESLSCGSWFGVAEPDLSRGDVEGSAEHVVAFVITACYRAVALQLVAAALDDVALLVDLGVELWCTDFVSFACAPTPNSVVARTPASTSDGGRWRAHSSSVKS